jgi:membrane protease YdiL (CAAX protease family)
VSNAPLRFTTTAEEQRPRGVVLDSSLEMHSQFELLHSAFRHAHHPRTPVLHEQRRSRTTGASRPTPTQTGDDHEIDSHDIEGTPVSGDLRSTLIKVGLPLLAMVILLTVAKLRGFDLREFAGLHRPPGRLFALFLGLWVVWMAVTELLLHWLGGEGPPPWRDYALPIVILRIVAIGILGPISEELVFRGGFYSRLATRLGAAGAILGTAAIFTVMHYGYSWTSLAFVFADGLIFGYARYKTRSVYTPMAMHVIGNLFSIGQSLT